MGGARKDNAVAFETVKEISISLSLCLQYRCGVRWAFVVQIVSEILEFPVAMICISHNRSKV